MKANFKSTDGKVFYQCLLFALFLIIISNLIGCSSSTGPEPDELGLQPDEILAVALIGQPLKVTGTNYLVADLFDLQLVEKGSQSIPDPCVPEANTPFKVIVFDTDLAAFNSQYLQRPHLVLRYQPETTRPSTWVFVGYSNYD